MKVFDGVVESIRVRSSQTGPLSGTTFMAKDNFDVSGFTTGAGLPDWKRTHKPALKNAAAINALLAAGSTLAGKTCMDELAFSLDGINIHFGIPENPNMKGHIPGGSSSGSASVVASGLCDLALGTDTAGSVRVPGAFCGVYSMRPSHGRISLDGVLPLGPSFDTVGWFARDAALFARCGEVLLEESVAAAGSKTATAAQISLLDDCLALLDQSLQAEFIKAAQRLHPALSAEKRLRLPEGALAHYLHLFDKIRSFEAWQYFGSWLEKTDPQMQDEIKARFYNCRNSTENDCRKAQEERAKVIEFLNELLSDRIICIPTVCDFPLSCDSSDRARAAQRSKNMLLNIVAGIGGLPQVNLPLPLSANKDGRPLFALSLIGKQGSDSLLLETTLHFASALSGN